MSTVISPRESKACLLLLAVDDEIVEDNELFTVTVETENPRDTVNGNASIIVSDNDGEDLKVCLLQIAYISNNNDRLHRCTYPS